MKYELDKIRNHFSADIYWSKIHFYTDDGNKKTTVLFCASIEYLLNKFGTSVPQESDLRFWANEVIKKWETKGDQIFEKNTYYDAYGTTESANNYLMNFLSTK